MPIFYQQTINEHTKLGVWKIEEAEDFFLQKALLSQDIKHPHKRLQHLAGRYLLQHLFPFFPTTKIEISDARKPYLPGAQFHFSISHCGNFAAAIVSKNISVGIDIELYSEKTEKVKNKFLSEKEIALINCQPSTDNRQPSTDNRQPTTVNRQPTTVNRQPTTVNRQPTTVNRQPTTVNRQPTTVNRQLSTVNRQLSTVNQQLSTTNYQLPTLLWCCKEAVYKWWGLGGIDFRRNIIIEELNSEQQTIKIIFTKKTIAQLTVQYILFDELCLAWTIC